ncbi:MAG: hypothetical protein HC820_03620 [Hydrococcus sp. RM1_1_31]|nr:hypothetical protein [Hydrococcus sp. RM1_1_31]
MHEARRKARGTLARGTREEGFYEGTLALGLSSCPPCPLVPLSPCPPYPLVPLSSLSPCLSLSFLVPSASVPRAFLLPSAFFS